MHDACTRAIEAGLMKTHPILEACAAISVGVVNGIAVLDLEYIEDSNAETDMNVVMTAGGNFVEVQGTAEGAAFSRAELNSMLDLAEGGIRDIISAQQEMVATPPGLRALPRCPCWFQTSA